MKDLFWRRRFAAGSLCLLVLVGTGCKQKAPPAPSASLSPTASSAQEEARVKALAEILAEMMRVVLRREPKDSVEFSSWLEAIAQGASTEGIYLGFTHSSDYRNLETSGPSSKPECVTRFVREMKRIQAAMKQPTSFKAKDAEPLSEVVHPEEAVGGAAKNGVLPPLKFGKPAPAVSPTRSKDVSVTPEPVDLSKLFAQARFYTLKRVLGDETLRLFREKATSEERAAWYGPWAAELGKLGVDFGVALRNKADADFHRQWALDADENRVAWEVLNRVHRILNGCL